MMNRTRFAHCCRALMIGLPLLWAAGCSDDGLATRYPVSGKITYKGQPVAKGRITLTPTAASGHGAVGEIENGTFASVTTLNPGDGALPGDYKVSIDTREVDDAAVREEAKKLAAKHGMTNISQIPQELMGQARKNAKSSVPAKYETAETTTLKTTVKSEKNYVELDLTD
jgi:hypothetical protein